jgi:hypothetical protein
MCEAALQLLDWIQDPKTSGRIIQHFYAFTEDFIICRKMVDRSDGEISYYWAEYDPEKVNDYTSALDVGEKIDVWTPVLCHDIT